MLCAARVPARHNGGELHHAVAVRGEGAPQRDASVCGVVPLRVPCCTSIWLIRHCSRASAAPELPAVVLHHSWLWQYPLKVHTTERAHTSNRS